jgi:hypothetical protein
LEETTRVWYSTREGEKPEAFIPLCPKFGWNEIVDETKEMMVMCGTRKTAEYCPRACG